MSPISFGLAMQIWEQDEASLGSAYARGSAEVSTAVISYYNPAGMVRLEKPEVSFGGAMILFTFLIFML
jgi:long-chain fatty acid transport protein